MVWTVQMVAKHMTMNPHSHAKILNVKLLREMRRNRLILRGNISK